jgi:hypothetical protein
MSNHDSVTIELPKNRALVLYEFLRRCDDKGEYTFAHPAEQRVVWDLEIALQPKPAVLCDTNYLKMVQAAWAEIPIED